MSTVAAFKWLVPDLALRILSATTTNSTAVLKGTATDLLVQVSVAPDGATPVAGTFAFMIQGSNDGVSWNLVTPDKGTLSNLTAAGISGPLHVSQLWYARYRVVTTTTGGSVVGNVRADFYLLGVQDMMDSTIPSS